MNILICNDDGYLAQGIGILARTAAEFADIRVVAPDRNRSGVSNSLTLDRPLTLRTAENGFYYVSGTPTDCIHLALHAMPDFVPDLVLSGINHGANLGDDTLYSGTVAAATEAYLLGIPAVALSLAGNGGSLHWETAEAAARQIVARLCAEPPRRPVLWNINIPSVVPDALKGIKTVRLGRRHHTQSIVPARNPRGEAVYWIGPAGSVSDGADGTDFDACEAGYITLTPLQIDLTDFPGMHQAAGFAQKLPF